MGVKKSGTMTLDKFLNYHPNIVVDGENGFFGTNKLYRRGLPYLISTMPRAKKDELILMKSRGVWARNDSEVILTRLSYLPTDCSLVTTVIFF